jgi:catechol 2,3-dioxygenase-like lactoylglutathione lyase family enzyme
MTVNHVGHCVADLERSKRFYVEALGFHEWFAIAPPDNPSGKLLAMAPPLGMQCVYLRNGDFVLELLRFAEAGTADAPTRVMNNVGLTHISLAVDDIAAACQRVEQCGGTVITQTDIGAAVFVRDPDGQLLELLPASYR